MWFVKKFTSISLFVLYLLFSLGLVVKAHYCGGDLAAINLFEKGSCCCEKPNKPSKDDCCKDEIKSLKLTSDQLKSEDEEFKALALDIIIPTNSNFQWIQPSFKKQASNNCKVPDPPERNSFPPLFIKHHCIIYYS